MAIANPNSCTQFDNSVLTCDLPHTDGLYIIGAEELANPSFATLSITRTAGPPITFSLNRTAAGAETYGLRLSLGQLIRLGEIPSFQQFGITPPAQPAKGVKITDFFVISNAGVVALTSATLRFSKTVFSTVAAPPGGALTQTHIVAPTAVVTATSANPVYQKVAVPAGSQVFSVDDLGLLELEYLITMAGTGTIAIYAMGVHMFFNYT